LERLWVDDTSDWNYSGKISSKELEHQLYYHALTFKKETADDLWSTLSNHQGIIQANKLKDLLHQVKKNFERDHNAGRKATLELPGEDQMLASSLLREWKTIHGAWIGMDKDGNNRITLIEFTKGIETSCKRKFGISKISSMWSQMDFDESHSIEFDEFVPMLKSYLIKRLKIDKIDKKILRTLKKENSNLKKFHRKLDKNRDNFITITEFAAGLQNCGLNFVGIEDVALLWKILDRDSSGKIDPEEFFTGFGQLLDVISV